MNACPPYVPAKLCAYAEQHPVSFPSKLGKVTIDPDAINRLLRVVFKRF
jgi:hypothetical protein